jgi:hypothetical protein
MTIPVLVVDRHFWEASALFNPNAFPDRAKPEASLCGDRLAILTHSVEVLKADPGLSRGQLLNQVRNDPAWAGFKPDPEKPAVLIFHNLSFATGLYSALIMLKSLLDLYARLVRRLLVPKADMFGFASGEYKGRKNLAGGKFLRWLEKSTPASFARRDELVATFLRHLDEWLDQAVEYRDHIVHDGFVPGVTEMMAPLDKTPQALTENDLILPKMPDQTEVTVYCDLLVKNTRDLIFETLSFLPDIDFSMLSHGQPKR